MQSHELEVATPGALWRALERAKAELKRASSVRVEAHRGDVFVWLADNQGNLIGDMVDAGNESEAATAIHSLIDGYK